MIYIGIFLLILLFVVKFDFPYLTNYKSVQIVSYHEVYNTRTRYYTICLIFVFISGLAYRVGSDIGRYMYDFDHVQWQDFSLKSLSLSDRQPLWMFFQLLCKSLLDSFTFFKLTISIFVNAIVFYFIRNNTRYVYTSLLLYYIMMSFDINFNILRQSLAICSFLLAFHFLDNKKILLSLCAIFVAIMFHNSAFVLLPIPLFLLFDTRKYFNISILVVWLISFCIILSPTAQFLLTLFLGSSDETLMALSSEYLQGDYGSSSFSIVKVSINLLYFSFISYYYKKSGAGSLHLSLLFCYIICFIASYSIPILGRIKFYFTLFYIISFCEAIYCFIATTFNTRSRKLLISIVLLLFVLNSSKHYFIYNTRLGAYNYVQYYPYSSVINPKIINERERLVDY